MAPCELALHFASHAQNSLMATNSSSWAWLMFEATAMAARRESVDGAPVMRAKSSSVVSAVLSSSSESVPEESLSSRRKMAAYCGKSSLGCGRVLRRPKTPISRVQQVWRGGANVRNA